MRTSFHVSVDWQRLGPRLRSIRLARNASIRSVAERASVDKNTVMRAENGKPVHFRSLERLCEALGTSVERQLAANASGGSNIALCRQDQWVWTNSKNQPVEQEAVSDQLFDAPSVRRWRAASGVDKVFLGVIASSFGIENLMPCICEVHAETQPTQLFGDHFFFCLRGEVRVSIGDESVFLNEHDSISSTGPGPLVLSPTSSTTSPPLLLVLRGTG